MNRSLSWLAALLAFFLPFTASAQSDADADSASATVLTGRYVAAIRAAIESKWNRPESIQGNAAHCGVHVRQLPGGEVIEVRVASPCTFDEDGRRSIEAAVLKAQPLPYAGFEAVFSRSLYLDFGSR